MVSSDHLTGSRVSISELCMRRESYNGIVSEVKIKGTSSLQRLRARGREDGGGAGGAPVRAQGHLARLQECGRRAGCWPSTRRGARTSASSKRRVPWWPAAGIRCQLRSRRRARPRSSRSRRDTASRFAKRMISAVYIVASAAVAPRSTSSSPTRPRTTSSSPTRSATRSMPLSSPC